MKNYFFVALIFSLAGCGHKHQEPPVHNAFVDHIEAGHQTIDAAQARIDAENARIHAQDSEAQTQ